MAQQQQSLDLNTLSLEQLNMLKQQLEEEINLLSNSFSQLKMAGQRYLESKECLTYINKDNEGKQSLIPLTSSLFVMGELADTENVLIDIGTGYYVQKSVPDAKDYADRKVKLVTEQAEKVQQVVVGKRKNLETVLMVMQQKIYQYEKEQGEKAQ